MRHLAKLWAMLHANLHWPSLWAGGMVYVVGLSNINDHPYLGGLCMFAAGMLVSNTILIPMVYRLRSYIDANVNNAEQVAKRIAGEIEQELQRRGYPDVKVGHGVEPTEPTTPYYDPTPPGRTRRQDMRAPGVGGSCDDDHGPVLAALLAARPRYWRSGSAAGD